jgi:hypothetical protein
MTGQLLTLPVEPAHYHGVVLEATHPGAGMAACWDAMVGTSRVNRLWRRRDNGTDESVMSFPEIVALAMKEGWALTVYEPLPLLKFVTGLPPMRDYVCATDDCPNQGVRHTVIATPLSTPGFYEMPRIICRCGVEPQLIARVSEGTPT